MSRYSPTERIGVSAIENQTSSLGWIFREQPIVDMGIDAHIEVVDSNNNPTGRLLGAQIKTGASHFKDKTDHLVYYGSITHLEYWLKHSLPVILIAYLPENKQICWVEVSKDSIEMTEKSWKIKIPKSQLLDERSLLTLSSIADGTKSEVRYRNLLLHTGLMEFLDNGGTLQVKKEDWLHKFLSRGLVQLIKTNLDGTQEIIESNNFVYSGYEITEAVETVYPWATVHLDEDFYADNLCESVYGIFPKANLKRNRAYPYVVLSGEVGLYMFKLELNDLGKSFLQVIQYLNAN